LTLFVTNVEAMKKRRLQPQENRILRGKEGNFQRRIELIDASVYFSMS